MPDTTTIHTASLSRHVHSRSLDISTDKAARHARLERTWKVIKQELLDYITGEDMPNDAIEWYERVRELHWKTEPSSSS